MKSLPITSLCALALFAGMAEAQTGRIVTACADDIAQFCSDLSHIGGGVQICLGDHADEVSEACQTAMDTAGPAGRRYGWGPRMQDQAPRMGLRRIVAAIGALGYTDIEEIEFDDGQYEIEASDADGVSVELYVDPATGEIVRIEADDE